MGFLDKLRGKKPINVVKPPQHAVIVQFRYGSTNLDRVFALERELEAVIEKDAVGEYDGNEVSIDGSEGTLFLYGPDADRLYEAVEPTLKACPFMRGASVKLRYGGPAKDAPQRDILIDA